MNLFGMLELSGSALGAERQRAEVVASNMANVQTTRTVAGGPYRRQLVVFQSQRAPRFSLALADTMGGLHRNNTSAVRVAAVLPDQRPPVMRFEPGHPDANAEGYVAYPQVDPIEEMADLLGAVRAYELNASAVQATKNMIAQSLDLLR
jgi:flagellar basal-body rod protein FlgC